MNELGNGRMPISIARPRVDEIAPLIPPAIRRFANRLAVNLGLRDPNSTTGFRDLLDQGSPGGSVALPGLGHPLTDSALKRVLQCHDELPSRVANAHLDNSRSSTHAGHVK